MTASKIWTRAEIENLINNSDVAVGRAIVALFKRQTADEQASESTNHHNNIGFCGWAAKNGSYYARWVMSGRTLDGKHLLKARRIALHHAGQVTDIANEGRIR